MRAVNSAAGFVPVSAATLEERMAFLKKVYGLLSISVFVAAAAAWLTMNSQFAGVVYRNYIVFIVLEFAVLFFAMWARKKEMLGLIALFSFTMLTGIVAAPALLIYKAETVANAAFLTGVTFGGLSLYAVVSKKDFSFLGGMLFTGLIILIIGGLLNAFIFKSSGTSFLFSAAGVLIFSGFILYDTSNILRRYPTDEYIAATISLYLDILNLFMLLLRLLGGGRD